MSYRAKFYIAKIKQLTDFILKEMINMWKDIPNWEEYYAVNEDGEVINKLTGHLLIGDTNNAGYPRICLYNKNNTPCKQRFFRHRLVAQLFIPNPYNLPEVNHIDKNKLNPSSYNLEWCSREENEYHKMIYNKYDGYTPFCVTWDQDQIDIFFTASELANILKISKELVNHWLNNRSKSYINYNIKEIEYLQYK